MWSIIPQITTWIALAAFIAALIAWVARTRLLSREGMIKAATETDRARLVESALEFFHVATEGLTREQKYQLALQQIRARERRFFTVAVCITVLALGLGASAFLTSRSQPKSSIAPSPDSGPASTQGDPKSTLDTGGVVLSSLRVLDAGFGLPTVDVTLRNTTGSDASVHDAELLVDQFKIVENTSHPYALAVSYQYDALINPGDKEVSIPLNQVVAAHSVDRFQIILTVGSPDSSDKGPHGSARIRTPDIEGLDISQARLRINYNEGRTVTSKPFRLHLAALYGFRAAKQAGPTLEGKIRLLADSNINVVESAVRALATVGGPKAMTALEALRARDLVYLQNYYDSHIYSAFDRQYYALDAPEARLNRFLRLLDDAIKAASDTSPR